MVKQPFSSQTVYFVPVGSKSVWFKLANDQPVSLEELDEMRAAATEQFDRIEEYLRQNVPSSQWSL